MFQITPERLVTLFKNGPRFLNYLCYHYTFLPLVTPLRAIFEALVKFSNRVCVPVGDHCIFLLVFSNNPKRLFCSNKISVLLSLAPLHTHRRVTYLFLLMHPCPISPLRSSFYLPFDIKYLISGGIDLRCLRTYLHF